MMSARWLALASALVLGAVGCQPFRHLLDPDPTRPECPDPATPVSDRDIAVIERAIAARWGGAPVQVFPLVYPINADFAPSLHRRAPRYFAAAAREWRAARCPTVWPRQEEPVDNPASWREIVVRQVVWMDGGRTALVFMAYGHHYSVHELVVVDAEERGWLTYREIRFIGSMRVQTTPEESAPPSPQTP